MAFKKALMHPAVASVEANSRVVVSWRVFLRADTAFVGDRPGSSPPPVVMGDSRTIRAPVAGFVDVACCPSRAPWGVQPRPESASRYHGRPPAIHGRLGAHPAVHATGSDARRLRYGRSAAVPQTMPWHGQRPAQPPVPVVTAHARASNNCGWRWTTPQPKSSVADPPMQPVHCRLPDPDGDPNGAELRVLDLSAAA